MVQLNAVFLTSNEEGSAVRALEPLEIHDAGRLPFKYIDLDQNIAVVYDYRTRNPLVTIERLSRASLTEPFLKGRKRPSFHPEKHIPDLFRVSGSITTCIA